MDINPDIARKAAQIRAEYGKFKAMDALQLAAAQQAKCDLFVTNDKQLKQYQELACVTIDEWESLMDACHARLQRWAWG